MIAAAVATPGVEWIALASVIAMGSAGLVVVLAKAMLRRAPIVEPLSIGLGIAGCVATAICLGAQWHNLNGRSLRGGRNGFITFDGMVALDHFAVAIGAVIVIALVFGLLLLASYVRTVELPVAEVVALLCFSATGMLAMTTANDLVVVFVALEVLSIPLYVLVALDRRRLKSSEAGMKYFILGAFSSAIFLYGVALMYGTTGTTRLAGGSSSLLSYFSSVVLERQGMALLALVFLIVGLGFKVAAVPFHQWTPDVYQGAPTPITAFMASATKAAGFAALIRVLYTGLAAYTDDWRPILWALAALTLLVGSAAACVQTDVKRMLAYSSISHAGYVLVGVYAATQAGVASAVFYLFAYTFMVVGSFAVVGLVATRHDSDHSLVSYRGLARRSPQLAGLLTFFLLAQAGVPLTGGFVAKLNVFAAGVQSAADRSDPWGYVLVIVALLAAVIAAFFYLRIVVTMWTGRDVDLPEAEAQAEAEAHDTQGAVAVATRAGRAVRIDVLTGTVLFVCATVTVWLGVLPQWALELSKKATLIFTLR